MADVALVSQANVDVLLKVLKSGFLNKLSNVTVFTNASTKISTLDIIKTNGTGSNILANDGTYKDMRTSDINTITSKTTTIWSALNIQQNGSLYYPNIPVYNNLVTQVTALPIINNGDGTKFLNDLGQYVNVNIYRGLTSDEITTLCNDIKGGI